MPTPIIVVLLLCGILKSSTGVVQKSISFASRSGKLYANDVEFFIKGISWFGFETPEKCVFGLWGGASTIPDVIRILHQYKFNAVRLPLALDSILEDPAVNADRYQNDPEIQGRSFTYLQLLDHLIDKFAAANILVMLDVHRLRANGDIGELWYGNGMSEQQFADGWRILAQRYCASRWNVFASDLKNEPHGAASWGSGNAQTDWRLAAEMFGNQLLTQCSRWLVFIDGVETNVQGSSSHSWWGGNLQGVRQYPVRLSDPTKLVYSPHVYGPSVYNQQYFNDPAFPANMPPIWEADWAYIDSVAKVIGEWGGRYTDKDRIWQDAFAAFLKTKGIGFFYWDLNPESGDTGGFMLDWHTVDENKASLLAEFPSSNV